MKFTTFLRLGWVLGLVFVCASKVHAQDVSQQAEALNNQGKLYYQRLELDQAAAAFREAIRLSPDPRYYYNLCLALEQLEQLPAARAACNVAANSPTANPSLAEKAKVKAVYLDQRIVATRNGDGGQPSKPVTQPANPPNTVNPRPTYPPSVGTTPNRYTTPATVSTPGGASSNVAIDAGAALSIPQGDSSDFIKPSFGILVNGTYWFTQNIGILAGFRFISPRAKGDEAETEGADLSYSDFDIGARFGVKLGDALRAYGDAALILGNFSVDTEFGTFSQSGTGLLLRGGMQLGLGPSMFMNTGLSYSSVTFDENNQSTSAGWLSIEAGLGWNL